MADALVSIVLEQLVTVISRELEQEVRLVVGVRNQVQKLTRTFQAIQRVLADAETRQLREDDVKLWLDQLRDVSYEMDDVLDEWSAAILTSKIQDHHVLKKKNKVCNSFKGSCCFRCNEVGLRHDISHKIKELNQRLDYIATEKDKYNFNVVAEMVSEQILKRPATTCFVDKKEVKGRDLDRNDVRNMLVRESSSSQKSKLQVISVVGMGGIGKTTLAQVIYDDEIVKGYFEKRVWVCVSDPFDEIKIANLILESLRGQESSFGALQPVMEQIKEYLDGKRFLVVLDDVWNEDLEKWKRLRDGLDNWGSAGSRILVTTRKENVASIMGCTKSDIVQLGQLSKEDCWSIFCQVAFFEKSSREFSQLEDIGRKIVDKCNGLPLAAKTMGGLLRFRNSRAQWESVLKNDLWQLKNDEIRTDLFVPLWLSYYDLRPELRQCFAYCAVFPKDFLIEKDDLIKLWMAQGYLKAGTTCEEMEILGEEYFQNLAQRSFFQNFEKDDDGRVRKCQMHDIVHDFAQFVTRNECLMVELISPEEPTLDSTYMDHTRHAMVVFKRNCPFPTSFNNLKRLRSLLVHAQRLSESVAEFLPSLLDHLTRLRALDISWCDIIEIPPKIRALKHLRYLGLSYNGELKELPEAICELYNLQTLHMCWCMSLVKLPNGIGQLINLRHLCITEANFLVLPKAIGTMTSLRTLDYLIVRHDAAAFRLGDLNSLNCLQGFIWIKGLGSTVGDVDQAKEAQLKEKKNISSLRLEFCKDKTEDRKQQDEELLEALQPSSELEELRVVGYQGTRMSPSWMTSLKNLRRLHLQDFINCECLPQLGKLPFLEYLNFAVVPRLESIHPEFLGLENNGSTTPLSEVQFPKLLELSFSDMNRWVKWDCPTRRDANGDAASIVVMPCLTRLILYDCHSLVALPDILLQSKTLKHLSIVRCPLLTQRYRKGSGDYWDTISRISEIEMDE